MENFLSVSVMLKLFPHTDFHAKNETGKFISVILVVRVARPLICHTFQFKKTLCSPSLPHLVNYKWTTA